MDVVRRALGYVNNEMPKHLKPEPGEVSLLLYAAYVVTSYPKSLPEAALGYKFAKAWADYADKPAGQRSTVLYAWNAETFGFMVDLSGSNPGADEVKQVLRRVKPAWTWSWVKLPGAGYYLFVN